MWYIYIHSHLHHNNHAAVLIDDVHEVLYINGYLVSMQTMLFNYLHRIIVHLVIIYYVYYDVKIYDAIHIVICIRFMF